jgi:hypothetical protein
MLAARGEAQFFGSIRRKLQNPIRQTLCVKQFSRLGIFKVRVAGIFCVETKQGGFVFFCVARLECFGHAGVLRI